MPDNLFPEEYENEEEYFEDEENEGTEAGNGIKRRRGCGCYGREAISVSELRGWRKNCQGR